MTRLLRLPLVLPICLLLATAARAEVLDSRASGFAVRETRVIAAPIGKVWQGLVKPAAWWSPDHTFSHDARNLTLEARPGGEWLEILPNGGGARHMVVIYAAPPSTLRLEGALGPLQALGVAGHLTFTLADQRGSTLITATYDVGGHSQGGFDEMAAAVDHVLDAQLGRLKTYAETGVTP
jgi:uncharacterized protein YndB with AHSA1/START domain